MRWPDSQVRLLVRHRADADLPSSRVREREQAPLLLSNRYPLPSRNTESRDERLLAALVDNLPTGCVRVRSQHRCEIDGAALAGTGARTFDPRCIRSRISEP
jgi:hypothetical protein